MKLLRRTALALVLSLTTLPTFAQVNMADVQKQATDLVDALALALPFNSTIGLNWSDAYIGQLVSVPPHFGAGVVTGATAIDAGSFQDMLAQFGYSKDLGNKLYVPAISAEGRIGGFILPFDVGLKVGFIPKALGTAISSVSSDLDINYLLVGGDIRYAVLKGGVLLPAISVGVGFNYLKGSVSTSVGSAQSFTYGGNTITATAPDITLDWACKTLDAKVQISKGLLIFTPYLGLGASYGWTTAGYSIDSTVSASSGSIASMIAAMNAAGLDAPDISKTGISYETSASGFSARAFGGFSVNMIIVKLDLTGLYNLRDQSYGGSVGVRVQL